MNKKYPTNIHGLITLPAIAMVIFVWIFIVLLNVKLEIKFIWILIVTEILLAIVTAGLLLYFCKFIRFDKNAIIYTVLLKKFSISIKEVLAVNINYIHRNREMEINLSSGKKIKMYITKKLLSMVIDFFPKDKISLYMNTAYSVPNDHLRILYDADIMSKREYRKNRR